MSEEYKILIRGMESIPQGVRIQWAAKGIGFGELTVWMNDDGSVHVDDECMSEEFCLAVFKALLSQRKENK